MIGAHTGLPWPAIYHRRGGSSPGYVAKAVHFDGNAWLLCNSLAAIDNAYWAMSLWGKMNPADFEGPDRYIAVVDPLGNFTCESAFTNVDQFYFESLDASGSSTKEVLVTADGQSVLDNIWHNLIMCNDASTGVGALYLDRVLCTDTFSRNTPFTLSFNGLPFAVGGGIFDPLVNTLGDVADLWIAPGVNLLVDGEIPSATLDKFIHPITKKPVNPSGFPTSAMLFSGDAATFPVNQGTGGLFNLTGSLTNASSSPSD